MFKATLSSDGDVVVLSEVLEGLKINKKQFQEMCIAVGCDYLKNITGIGTACAFQLAATGGDIQEALVQMGVDETYQANFHKAIKFFTIRQCLIWNHVLLSHLRNETLTHAWMFSTCVDSILVQNNLNHTNL